MNRQYYINSQNENNHLVKYGLIHNLAITFVLIFISLIPWGDGVWDGLTSLFGTLSFGLAGLLLVTKGSHRNYSLFHFLVLVFGVWVIISVMWTPDIDIGIDAIKRVFQIMLLPFLFTLVLSRKTDITKAYQAYVFGGMIASVIILYNYLNGIESPYYNRYTVQNIETDIMSVILAIAIPMAAYLASHHQRKWLRILNLLAIPSIIFGIFLTGTRTGSIVAIIGVIYWLFTHRKASFKIKASIVVVFMLSIMVVLTFAPKASIDRVFSSGKSLKSGDLNYRTVIWGAAINQWKLAPIKGSGIGGLGYVLSKKHVNYDGAHNTYLHLLTENGIIGLIIYLLLLFSILYIILQTPIKEKSFLLSLFMVITVSQLTLHTQIQKETWFALTLLAIHARLHSDRSRSKERLP